ncbi:MAG: SDR family oxidoreductase [Cyanobacteria bacterium P01_H01_bin.15]
MHPQSFKNYQQEVKLVRIVDSTILITGANRGIGRALVEKSLEKGAAKVYATYRLEKNRSQFDEFGEQVVPVHLDLGNPALISQLSQSVPSLNILINNAGILSALSLLEDTEEELRQDFGINFFGTLAVTKLLLPVLKKENAAAIVNVASIASLAAMPSLGGYSASKAALHSMTQSIRSELKADGIAVHGVYPGPVATRMTEGFDMEMTSALVVAENILEGIENSVEDIFPDAMAQQTGPIFLSSPRKQRSVQASWAN